jgi:cob(I)alamin adenosyltransferase
MSPARPEVNMAETMEHRDKVQRSLEDIHRSLVAVSMKLAQLQLDDEIDTELANALEEEMTALGPLTDRLETLESEFQMETNRLTNEGELQG